MKILHTSSIWLPQTQTWMFTQCKYLPAPFEQHILCTRTQNLDQFPMANIHCFEQDVSPWVQFVQKAWRKVWSKMGGRANLPYMAGKAGQVGPDIVHSHFGSQGWADMPLVKKCGARHVVTFYGFDISRLPMQQVWRDRYADLFKSVDRFLCEGPHMGGCLESLGCPADKIRIQHLGIELDRYPYQPRTWKQGEPLRVLLAGTFTEKKGLPYAVDALGRISKDHDVHLTIIGDARPRSKVCLKEKQDILSAIDRHALSSRVTFLGYQPHARMIQEAYSNHLFVSPSVTAASGDTEGGAPVSIIEMAATGMPVISTTHCDIPSVLNYGEEGWLAEERDVDGLVAILKKWLSAPELWKQRVAHARKHIESEYDAVTQGKRLGKVYRELK